MGFSACTQAGSGTNNTSTDYIMAFTNMNIPAGAGLVLAVAVDNSGTSGVSAYSYYQDNHVPAADWTLQIHENRTAGAANDGTTLLVFTTVLTTEWGNSDPFVVFFSPNITAAAWAFYWVGLDNSTNYLEILPGASNGSSGNPSITTSTVHPTQLVIGANANEYGTAQTITSATGDWWSAYYAAIGTTTSGQNIAMQFALPTASGTQTFNPTYVSSSDNATGWILAKEMLTESFAVSAFIKPYFLVDAVLAPMHLTADAWIETNGPWIRQQKVVDYADLVQRTLLGEDVGLRLETFYAERVTAVSGSPTLVDIENTLGPPLGDEGSVTSSSGSSTTAWRFDPLAWASASSRNRDLEWYFIDIGLRMTGAGNPLITIYAKDGSTTISSDLFYADDYGSATRWSSASVYLSNLSDAADPNVSIQIGSTGKTLVISYVRIRRVTLDDCRLGRMYTYPVTFDMLPLPGSAVLVYEQGQGIAGTGEVPLDYESFQSIGVGAALNSTNLPAAVVASLGRTKAVAIRALDLYNPSTVFVRKGVSTCAYKDFPRIYLYEIVGSEAWEYTYIDYDNSSTNTWDLNGTWNGSGTGKSIRFIWGSSTSSTITPIPEVSNGTLDIHNPGTEFPDLEITPYSVNFESVTPNTSLTPDEDVVFTDASSGSIYTITLDLVGAIFYGPRRGRGGFFADAVLYAGTGGNRVAAFSVGAVIEGTSTKTRGILVNAVLKKTMGLSFDAQVRTEAPLAWWKFDEGPAIGAAFPAQITDYGSAGAHFTTREGWVWNFEPEGRFGNRGGAHPTNMTRDSIETFLPSGNSARTVEFFYRDRGGIGLSVRNSTLFSYGPLSSGQQFGVVFSNTSTGSWLRVWTSVDDPYWGSGVDSNAYTLDYRWHHYAITYDGAGNWELFWEGVSQGVQTKSSINTGGSGGNPLIGWVNYDGWANMKGAVSNLVFHSSKLATSTIAAHAASTEDQVLTVDAWITKGFRADSWIAGPYYADFALDAYIAHNFSASARIARALLTWVSPPNLTSMDASPVLVFNSVASEVVTHFEIQIDTADTFDTGDLRVIKSKDSQVGWEYWNGSGWTAFPSTGLAVGYSGNEVRHTIQTALAEATWYRRVRAWSA